MKQVVFIFSLPRSGSTLLQKILGAHSKIRTTAEPWLLLPLFEIDHLGLDSYFEGNACRKGVVDFISNLPQQKKSYLVHISNAVRQIYLSLLQGDENVIIDKTPRYYNLINEIYEYFPDAKLIFLFRNPLSVYASISQSWCSGRYVKRKSLARDLYDGPRLLANAYMRFKESPNVHLVRYDELANNTDKIVGEIFSFLEVDYECHVLSSFKDTDLGGRLGDNLGVHKYSSISSESQDKWKKYVSSKSRKKVLENFLNTIPDNYFEALGGNREHLKCELNSIAVKKIGVLDWLDNKFSGWCRQRCFRQFLCDELSFRLRKAE